MKPIVRFAILPVLALAAQPTAASAKVVEASDRGFVVRHVAEIPADVDTTWAMLIKPSEWWASEHTWSGSSANLSIDPRPGGCFCEVLPNAASPKAAPRGGVEHMRVVYIERGRALRMVGALGPLQSDAAIGTLTIQLKSAGAKTQILLEYVVGGYVRMPAEKISAGVDGVLGEQLGRLATKLGGAFAAAFGLPAEAGEAQPVPPAASAVLPLPAQAPEADGRKPVGR
jgi:hypothetical protein